MESFSTKVVGVTYGNDDGSTRQAIIADLKARADAGPVNIRLRREHHNKDDPHAVAVDGPDGRQLGFLSRQDAARVAKLLDMGGKAEIELAGVTGGGNGQFFGVNIRLRLFEPHPAPAAAPASVRMFPSELPDWVRRDPKRGAEVEIYDALARALPGSYEVFHSVGWLDAVRPSADGHGEADFVVMDRNRSALLVIEVKGGAVARDGAAWTSRDRHGQVHSIHDPIAQAHKSQSALYRNIRAAPDWGDRWIVVGWAVAFPHVNDPRRPLGIDQDRPRTLFREDLPTIDKWVSGAMDCFVASRSAAFDARAVAILRDLLSPRYQLRQALGSVLDDENARIVSLTEEQYDVLDQLDGNARVGVVGSAGTGKTMLAAEKAKRLVQLGARVLLTCFNRPLADNIRDSLPRSERLDVLTFDALCWKACGENYDMESWSAERKGEALFDAFGKSPDWRYEAILVDEAQDFDASWWDPLQLALEPKGPALLYAFYDDNQQIYPKRCEFLNAMPSFRLTKNLRNTRQIHAYAHRYYKGQKPKAAGPEGRPVAFEKANSPREKINTVSRLLHRLIEQERVRPDDIAILCGESRKKSEFCNLEQIGQYAVSNKPADRRGNVLVDTIRRFKGLESSVVILVEIDSAVRKLDRGGVDDGASNPVDLLYVGLSRARLVLFVVCDADTLDTLKGSPIEG